MKNHVLTGLATGALLTLSGCGGDGGGDKTSLEDAPEAAKPDREHADEPLADAPAALPGEPPTAFLQCRSCHAVEPGKNGVGPTLAGVFGKPAASAADFRYSAALRESGITWNRENLDEWLEAPARMVPGTRMVQMVRDEGQRKAIIDYLETLE